MTEVDATTAETNQSTATKVNRPKDNAFHQQRLKAWRPVLTVYNTAIWLLAIGLLFVAVGLPLLIYAMRVEQKVVDYTMCEGTFDSQHVKCHEKVQKPEFVNQDDPCKCEVEVKLEKGMQAPVYLYYGLTNFYQNHLHYVFSKDSKQLHGEAVTADNLDRKCEPYRTKKGTDEPYAPCGAIAASLFNDTFKLELVDNTKYVKVPTTNEGIAWRSDANAKYGEPASFDGTAKPIGWRKTAKERGGYSGDEALMVWMRLAALPTFRKLYEMVNHGDGDVRFAKGLPAGTYRLTVDYYYPVTHFGGTKRFILTTSNFLGGRNLAVGIAYLVVGVFTAVLGLSLILIGRLYRDEVKI